MGEQCAGLGIKNLFNIDRNFVPSLPVLFSDGMKGIEEALSVWGGAIHHAYCARHLAGSTRHALKRLRNLDTGPRPRMRFDQMNALARRNEYAAKHLHKKDRGRYLQSAMMSMQPKPVRCHDKITSGLVEGTNGVLVEMRKEDPYTMVHRLITYIAGQFDKHQKESQKWKDGGQVLTPYASKLFASQKTLAMANKAYTVQAIGS